jgi:steroid delta-isomerase-like uncharacterized protein
MGGRPTIAYGCAMTWADDFFAVWQRAWETDTAAVLEHVTDDIEYWDVTLTETLRGRAAYASYVDGFFAAFTAITWSLREPVIAEGDRVTEPWRCQARNSGPLWIGLPASGRTIDTIGTDIFEFRDGRVCREHSFYDVTGNLRQLGLWPGIGSPVERGLMGVAGLGLRARRAVGG